MSGGGSPQVWITRWTTWEPWEAWAMISVPGHRLMEQGAAYGGKACPEVVCVAYGRQRLQGDARLAGGHALCECGEQSPHLGSSRERREWHRGHKRRLVDGPIPQAGASA